MNNIIDARMNAREWLQGLKSNNMDDFNHSYGYTRVLTSFGHIGAAFFFHEEKDKYQNDVTIIELSGNRRYRMVHRIEQDKHYQCATVYGERGRFFKTRSRFYDKSDKTSIVDVHNFHVEWKNNVNINVHCIDKERQYAEDVSIITALQAVSAPNWEQCILMVILWLEIYDNYWWRKKSQPTFGIQQGEKQ